MSNLKSKNMSIIKSEKLIHESVIDVAKKMIIAAKTAPKGRGIESLSYLLVTGKELGFISEKMIEISKKNKVEFFARDAANLVKSNALILIGTNYNSRNVPLCKGCSFGCEEKPKNVPCSVAITDLGIALGSAVSIASQFHVDNRIMFSVGVAAIKLKLFPPSIKTAYGIPLSISEKNIFFDRK